MNPTNEQELDEVLRNLYNIGRHEESGGSTDRELAFNEAKQAILDWHNKQVDEAVESVEKVAADVEYKAGINYAMMSGEYIHKDEANKQVEEVLGGLESINMKAAYNNGTFDEKLEQLRYELKRAIEAERNKLKEVK